MSSPPVVSNNDLWKNGEKTPVRSSLKTIIAKICEIFEPEDDRVLLNKKFNVYQETIEQDEDQ